MKWSKFNQLKCVEDGRKNKNMKPDGKQEVEQEYWNAFRCLHFYSLLIPSRRWFMTGSSFLSFFLFCSIPLLKPIKMMNDLREWGKAKKMTGTEGMMGWTCQGWEHETNGHFFSDWELQQVEKMRGTDRKPFPSSEWFRNSPKGIVDDDWTLYQGQG